MPRVQKKSVRGNPKIPWEEFEKQVTHALSSAGGKVDLRVEGKRTLSTDDQDYEVDAYAELTVFGGAKIKIIIECKRHGRPINRDAVLALHAKIQDLGAHKAMLFSTSGFQKGAISYAKRHGVALVKVSKRRKERTYQYAVPLADAPDYMSFKYALPSPPPMEFVAHNPRGDRAPADKQAAKAGEHEPTHLGADEHESAHSDANEEVGYSSPLDELDTEWFASSPPESMVDDDSPLICELRSGMSASAAIDDWLMEPPADVAPTQDLARGRTKSPRRR